MASTFYTAAEEQVVPWATDGSIDLEDFVLVMGGPHHKRTGFIDHIEEDGTLIIREPVTYEDDADDSAMSVDGSPPPDDDDSKPAGDAQEMKFVSEATRNIPYICANID
jgi:hypothetical protein